MCFSFSHCHTHTHTHTRSFSRSCCSVNVIGSDGIYRIWNCGMPKGIFVNRPLNCDTANLSITQGAHNHANSQTKMHWCMHDYENLWESFQWHTAAQWLIWWKYRIFFCYFQTEFMWLAYDILMYYFLLRLPLTLSPRMVEFRLKNIDCSDSWAMYRIVSYRIEEFIRYARSKAVCHLFFM